MMPGPATIALLLLSSHTPPGTGSVNVMPEPTHTVEMPVMSPDVGKDTTVTTFTALAVPQLLVTE